MPFTLCSETMPVSSGQSMMTFPSFLYSTVSIQFTWPTTRVCWLTLILACIGWFSCLLMPTWAAPHPQPNLHKPHAPTRLSRPAPASLTTPSLPISILPLPVAHPGQITDARPDFILCLTRDLKGNVWVGTEDTGVWRGDPHAPVSQQWTHFTRDSGLGDDCAYAITCDHQGRIWAGHLNHGVSVFDGQQWHNYNQIYGPLGGRVFALATSPLDGDVWTATESGLCRYSEASRSWAYYSRIDGLPSNQTNALAFAPDGTLYVGTQCDGLAVGSADDDYRRWCLVPGPADVPKVPTGTGLPSGLITALLVGRGGIVYCGTGHGVASSHDSGQTWRYRRAGLKGEDYLLRDDYVTALAEDGNGLLWIGHRQSDVEVFDPANGRHIPLPEPVRALAASAAGAGGTSPDKYMSALVPFGAYVLLGGYRGGLNQAALPRTASLTADGKRPTPPATFLPPPAAAGLPPLPASAKPPTLDELNGLLKAVGAVAPEKDGGQPLAVALDDDWITEGDWLGRYGRYWACLCAMCSPSDYTWGAGWEPISYRSRMGPNCTPGDSLRFWVHWLYTSNPKSLEMPPTYLDSRVQKKLTTWSVFRRQSEQDDHGEAYPMSQDGPNIDTTLTVPAGLYYLSLYEFNKDGHDSSNRLRDYRISLRMGTGDTASNISDILRQPELAHSRVVDFWGGVWKRFLVRGPTTLTVEVNRNNSFNTILPGIMLDLVDEMPAPYFRTVSQWKKDEAVQEERRKVLLAETPAAHNQRFFPAKSDREAANRLFDALSDQELVNPGWWAANGHRFYGPLLRWYWEQYYSASRPSPRLLARLGTCCYQMGLFTSWEDCQSHQGLKTARQIEKALRWNGISDAGQGYQVVTSYLAAKQGTKTSRR